MDEQVMADVVRLPDRMLLQQLGASDGDQLFLEQALRDQVRPLAVAEPDRNVRIRIVGVDRIVGTVDAKHQIGKLLLEPRQTWNEKADREGRQHADMQRPATSRRIEM